MLLARHQFDWKVLDYLKYLKYFVFKTNTILSTFLVLKEKCIKKTTCQEKHENKAGSPHHDESFEILSLSEKFPGFWLFSHFYSMLYGAGYSRGVL